MAVSLEESKTRALDLESLVDELMKDQPNEAILKKMMKAHGITYCADPIEQLNTVLKSLHVSKTAGARNEIR